MPELPEVESVRQSLRSLLIGRTVRAVRVSLPRIVRSPDVDEFTRSLEDQEFQEIRRRGKYLLIDIGPYTLVSHLRMEGRYGLYPSVEPLQSHTHVVFDLDDGQQLRYRDVRQFGTMDLLPRGAEERLEGVAGLGREPLCSGFDASYLGSRLAGRRTPIKVALLSQAVVAGLGNIYVDEVLFRAKIHPLRQAGDLRQGELQRLAKATIAVITEAVAAGGSSIRSYVNGFGEMGSFQAVLNVYAKTGNPCPRCGHLIEKDRVGGRGTHWCPRCQRLPQRGGAS